MLYYDIIILYCIMQEEGHHVDDEESFLPMYFAVYGFSVFVFFVGVLREKGEVPLRGLGTPRCSFLPNASVQWPPGDLTIHTKKWLLGAGFLGAPPISLRPCSTACRRRAPGGGSSGRCSTRAARSFSPTPTSSSPMLGHTAGFHEPIYMSIARSLSLTLHICIYIYIYVYVHIYIYIYIYIIYTYMYTYIHTYIHTYMYVSLSLSLSLYIYI